MALLCKCAIVEAFLYLHILYLHIIMSHVSYSTPAQMTTASTIINGVGSGVRLYSADESPQSLPTHYNNCPSISPRAKLPRYRSMFNNTMSPLTPSFGILPLESNTPEPTVLPSHTTLTEANDQKSLAKRVSSLRAHVGVSFEQALFNF